MSLIQKTSRALLIVSFIGAALLYYLLPPVWQLKEGPIEVTRWPKSGQQTFMIGPDQQRWTPFQLLSRHLVNAVVVSEDARFYSHQGIDWIEIRKSLILNIAEQRYARGASTITQQLVKMAFLTSDKTLLRKIRESLGALLLEQLISKSDILTWYLNLVPFGDGVFGAEAAASHYFNTSAELLTIQQSTHLALVLPSPNVWSEGLRNKQLTEFGHKRYRHIIERLYEQKFITQTLMQAALKTGNFGGAIREEASVNETGTED